MHDKAIEHRKSIIYQTAHVSLANGLQLHQDFMDFYHKQRDLKASFASTPLHSCTLSKNPERMRKYLQNQEYEPNVTDIVE
jgi:hypothetical protein